MKQHLPYALMGQLLKYTLKNSLYSVLRSKSKWLMLALSYSITLLITFSAHGQITEAWVKSYKGKAGSGGYGKFVQLDAEGNIYVAGETINGNSNDLAVIKYNPAGDLIWETSYEISGNDMLVDFKLDASGNSYLLGRNSSTYGIVIVKFNNTGIKEWNYGYSETTYWYDNYADNPVGLGVDKTGNVYVTANYSTYVKQECYTYTERCGSWPSYRTCTRTSCYNVYSNNTYTLSLSSTGNFINVVKTQNRSVNSQFVDNDGNVFLGSSLSNGANSDFLITKSDPSGNQICSSTFNSPSSKNDYLTKITVDGSGNIYAVGRSFSSGSTYDLTIVKFNSSGTRLWDATNVGQSNITPVDIKINVQGNVYVTYYSQNSSGNNDIVTLMYNQTGVKQWESIYNGEANKPDIPTAISVDALGNAYVTGYSNNGVNNDYITLKFTPTGLMDWSFLFNGVANNDDIGFAISIDKSNNVYVTGRSNTGSAYEFLTIKYATTFPVIISSDEKNPTNSNPILIKVDFEHAVTGFTIDDLTITGGAATKITGSGKNYVVEVIPAADGEITINIAEGIAQDALGATNKEAEQFKITYDGSAPATPVLATFTIDSGISNSDKITSDNTPTLSGSAEINSKVELFKDGVIYLTTMAGSSGSWSFTTPSLADGSYDFTLKATDAVGNISQPSALIKVQIDTKAPDSKIETSPLALMNTASASFSFSSDENNVSYQVSLDGNAYTSATNPLNLAGLVDGSHVLKVRAVDAAGNTDASPAEYIWVIDSKAPDAPVIATPVNGTITNNAKPALAGTAEANSVVRVYADGVLLGTVTAGVTGNWSYTHAIALGEGERTLTATATDAAANTGQVSNPNKVIIDLTPPAAPVIVAISEDRGQSATDKVTNDNTLQFAGTAEAGTTVKLYRAGQTQVLGTVVATTSGNWSISYNSTLTDDTHNFTATATDLAGNVSANNGAFAVVIDTSMPTVNLTTTVGALTKTAFTITITFNERVYGLTAQRFTLTNGVISNLTTADNLKFTATVTPVADGDVSMSLAAGSVSDLAGNGNRAGNTITTKYDATAPAGYGITFNVAKVDISNVTNVGLTVSNAEVNATYYYSISGTNGGTSITGSATATATGFVIPNLNFSGFNDGTITASFHQVDAAGNVGQAVTAQVEKSLRNIVAVAALQKIKVPFKTAFSSIALPREVEVTYANGVKERVQVQWLQGNYNSTAPANYIITGQLILAANSSNTENLEASIVVEVAPNKAPTNLALSSTTFKPNHDITAPIGVFTTTDEDDEQHFYELVPGNGDQDNLLFTIKDDQLYLKSINGLSGKARLYIRVRSTDPWDNYKEKEFVLEKPTYQPTEAIKIVNAFSPNNDGINDTWIVPELRYYDLVQIEVYDRAGIRLFYTKNPEKGWDGRNQNGQIVPGAYFYVIRIDDIQVMQRGVITVHKK